MRNAPSNRVSLLEGAAIVLISLFFVGTFFADGGFHFHKQASDYYGFLTDALCSGQAHLKIEPDPRLAQMDNPWVGFVGIPRLHDATYFNGHYYLYFGVAPVVLLMGPWHLLFGSFIPEAQVTAIFGLVATLAGLLILGRWARFTAVGPRWRALGILVWGVSSGILFVTQEPTFYFTAIACGAMVRLLVLYFIVRALEARSSRAALGWMAGASLGWGLEVASRPHFVLSLPLLLIPMGWLWLRSEAFGGTGGRVKLLLVTTVPAGCVGACIGWYNYIRFHSFTEFGFKYQFTIIDQRRMPMFSPDHLGDDLRNYLFQSTHWTMYFPFAVPANGMPGLMYWAPITLLALAAPLTLRVKALRQAPAWACAASVALAAALIHLFVLSVQVFYSSRYEGDFSPEFVLVGLAVGGIWIGRTASAAPALRRTVSLVVGGLALVSLFKMSCLVLQAAHSAAVRDHVAEVVDAPVGLFQKATDSLRGPYKLEVSFESVPVGSDAPLIETGIGFDAVFVRRIDPDHVRLGFEHKGNEPLLSAPLEIKHGYHQIVVVDVGSLYPPSEHIAYHGWNRAAIDLIRSRVRLSLDGALVMDERSSFYPSDPIHEAVGKDVRGFKDDRVPVAIYRSSRLRIPAPADILASGWVGPVRLHVRFPAYGGSIFGEPLVSTGSGGATDMVYVIYTRPGEIVLAQDGAHLGAIRSAPIPIDDRVEHIVDIDFGALDVAGPTERPVPGGLRVKLDGRWALNAPRASHFTLPAQVSFGFNSGTLSTAKESFSGTELRAEHIDSFGPGPLSVEGTGALLVTLQLDSMNAGTTEPLVTLGRSGAADIVFARFVGPDRVRIGIDHWGVGLSESEPIVLAPGALHTLGIHSAGLDPKESGIRLLWDGQLVVSQPGWTGHPVTPKSIALGANPAGGSTTNVPSLKGIILAAERLDPNSVEGK